MEHRAARSDGAPRIFGPDEAKRFYDRFGSWQDFQFYERAALEELVAHADFEQASVVFEFGCGTGRFAERLLEEHLSADARYFGIDVSTTMVELATRRLAPWRNRATVQLTNGTTTLPYGDHACDRCVMTYVLDLLSEPAIGEVLAEARRILRPGGRLCVASSTEGATTLSRVVSELWKRIYAFNPRLVGGCRPLDVSALLDPVAWHVEHSRTVCSWGIRSEILIASPA